MPPSAVPRAVTRSFAEALSAAELDRATSLFADDGWFITPDATAIQGRRGVRAILAQLTAGHVQLRVSPGSVQMVGDTALCIERWDFTYAGKDASPYTRASDSTVLMHRSAHGWKLSIVAPWHIVSANQDPFSSMPRLELACRS